MKKPYRFEIYQDKKKEFRYRVIHRNGKELFKSSEGYKSKKTMMRIWNDFVEKYDEMEFKDLIKTKPKPKMKTLILALFLMLSISATAQIQTPLSYGGGIQISNGQDINYYTSTVTLDVQYKFDKFIVASESQTLIIDTLTQFITGVKIGYEVKKWGDNKSLSVTGHALMDMFGGKPLGVGIQYNLDNTQLSIDYSYVNKFNQNRLSLNFGYLLIK